MLPEFKAILPFEWRWKPWIDLVEGTGVLVPALRWRVPQPALQRLWYKYEEQEPIGEAASEAAASAVSAMHEFNYAKAMWGRPNSTTQHLHPLDDPTDGARAFVELPTSTPWTPHTYEPASIARRWSDTPMRDDHSCIPLFRRWQALLLVELALAGPRTLGGIRHAMLRAKWPDLMPENDEWWPAVNLDGFKMHHSALEALSWNASYSQHAFMLFEGEKPSLGVFAGMSDRTHSGGPVVIQGAARAALAAAEEAIARDALSRHGLDENQLLAAGTWLGRAAVQRQRSGHAEVASSYARLMRESIELVISLGSTLAEVQERMQDGNELVTRLFPRWVDQARPRLTHLVTTLAGDFNRWPDPSWPSFDNTLVLQFVDWLEAAGLFAAHLSLPAIIDYGYRPDKDANVGVAMHVAGLAAWVEHVCNEALGAGWTGGKSLYDKLIHCWKMHPVGSDLCRAFECLKITKGAIFPDAVREVLAKGAITRAEWMARDARLAWLIRNEGLHNGFANMGRLELRQAVKILLRTAMGAWLATRPSTP